MGILRTFIKFKRQALSFSDQSDKFYVPYIYILYSMGWNVHSTPWNIYSSPWNVHSASRNIKHKQLLAENHISDYGISAFSFILLFFLKNSIDSVVNAKFVIYLCRWNRLLLFYQTGLIHLYIIYVIHLQGASSDKTVRLME